jgi:hypothetical protein
VADAGRAARRGGLVRVAVRGADLQRPERRHALLAAVDLVVATGAAGGTYASVTALPYAA